MFRPLNMNHVDEDFLEPLYMFEKTLAWITRNDGGHRRLSSGVILQCFESALPFSPAIPGDLLSSFLDPRTPTCSNFMRY